MAALNPLGISCSTPDSELIIRRYDGDFDGKLSYWEFSNMFMPVDAKIRSHLESRRDQAPPLSCETRALIIGMLTRIVDSERMVEQIRLMARREGFTSLREVFDEFDWMHRGFLTTTEVKRHFEQYPDET